MILYLLMDFIVINLIRDFFSRMRQIGKDRTDLYAGGVLQQNLMNDIYGSKRNKM